MVVSVIEIDQIETMLKGREVFMKAPIVGSAGLFWWRGHAKRLANLFKRTGHARRRMALDGALDAPRAASARRACEACGTSF
ncbi:MAG TPA: hypothetical protein VNN80_03995 [Polyangiaceae bacterium]|nr:hypothetical protein [Polyangiaceae bacterium]